jgi:hypothetical protein
MKSLVVVSLYASQGSFFLIGLLRSGGRNQQNRNPEKG